MIEFNANNSRFSGYSAPISILQFFIKKKCFSFIIQTQTYVHCTYTGTLAPYTHTWRCYLWVFDVSYLFCRLLEQVILLDCRTYIYIFNDCCIIFFFAVAFLQLEWLIGPFWNHSFFFLCVVRMVRWLLEIVRHSLCTKFDIRSIFYINNMKHFSTDENIIKPGFTRATNCCRY